MAKGTWQDYFQVGDDFWVIQLFDKAGYYKSVLAASPDQAIMLMEVKYANWVGVACSLPFQGKWEGKMPDITCPWPELDCLEGNQED